MTDIVKNYLTKIQIGAEQSFKNLSIFPLLSDYIIPFDYLTIDETISKDLIEVMEVQQTGSGPKQKVVNKSDQMILIYDGEKLVKAGHQCNIGAIILIPAKETVEISASITKKRRSFNYIHRTCPREHANSPRFYLEQFARVDSQVGTIFVINGKVAAMDCFGKPDVLEKMFMKMIEDYSQEAADQLDPKMNLKSSKADAVDFLKMAKESWVQTNAAARLVSRCRLNSEMCEGYALAREDQVLHLSLVAKN